MKLGTIGRARVALWRRLARALRRAPALRDALARRRPVPGLDRDVAAALAIDDLTGESRVWTGGARRARRMIAESAAVADEPPSLAVDARAIRVRGAEGALRARMYVPASAREAPAPAIVFFHGGGWVTGDLDTHDALCRRLAIEARARVIAVAYRRAPEHPFPAAAEDAVAAFRAIAQDAASLGIDPARVGVAGDSAGGNLSAVVALRTRGDARRPALALLLYPALDATCASPSHAELGRGFYLTREAMDWYHLQYFGEDRARRRLPDASPLLAPDLRGAPPMLVVTAAFDPLRDEGAAFVERLRAAGVDARELRAGGMVHGFAMMTALSPAARATTERIARAAGRALRDGLAAVET